MSRKSFKPPPLLFACRITHYVVRDQSIPFVGPTNLFVNGKELRAVPRLAIGEDKGEYLLLHCGSSWNVRGVVAYGQLSNLKRSIERIYPGISKNWLRTGFSRQQVEGYRRRIWQGLECSFCRRFPDQFEQLVEKRGVRICDICIREFTDTMRADRPPA